MKRTLLLLIHFSVAILSTQAQNLGIGISVPTQKLDVNGNVQFSGALMPAGNAGTTGQALLSNGSGVAPSWGSATAGQQWTTSYSTASVAVSNATFTNIPGLTQSVVIPATGTFDVFVYTDGGVQWTSNGSADNNAIQTELSIWIDGIAAKYSTLLLDNTNNFGAGIRNWAFGYSTPLSVGTHTIEVKARVVNWTLAQTTCTFAAANVLGNYLISSLSVGLIRK